MEICVSSKGAEHDPAKDHLGHTYRTRNPIKMMNACTTSLNIWLKPEWDYKHSNYSVTREGYVHLNKEEVQQIVQLAISQGLVPPMVSLEQAKRVAKKAVAAALDQLAGRKSSQPRRRTNTKGCKDD